MPVFSPSSLIETSTAIFAAAGMRSEPARIVAELLVEANLVGHDSHGVLRIPQYLGQVEAGDMIPDAAVEVVHEAPTLAVLDAHWGFGQVAMSRGVELGLEKARATDMATVAVRRANRRLWRVRQKWGLRLGSLPEPIQQAAELSHQVKRQGEQGHFYGLPRSAYSVPD